MPTPSPATVRAMSSTANDGASAMPAAPTMYGKLWATSAARGPWKVTHKVVASKPQCRTNSELERRRAGSTTASSGSKARTMALARRPPTAAPAMAPRRMHDTSAPFQNFDTSKSLSMYIIAPALCAVVAARNVSVTSEHNNNKRSDSATVLPLTLHDASKVAKVE